MVFMAFAVADAILCVFGSAPHAACFTQKASDNAYLKLMLTCIIYAGDVNKPKSCGLFSLCTRPIGTPGLNGLREDALVMDLPLSYHWPKLIIWCVHNRGAAWA